MKSAHVFTQLVHISFSNRFADDDSCCGCSSHRHDLEQLEKRACNGIGSNGTVRKIAENDVLQRDRAAENQRDHHEIQAMLEIVAHQAKIRFDQVIDTHAQSLIDQYIVNEDDTKLKRTCDQCADRGTAHTKLGSTEVALNEQIVDRAVGDQRNSRDDGGDAHDLHGAQKREQCGADAEKKIGLTNDTQVLYALFHDLGRIGEKPHDLIGNRLVSKNSASPSKAPANSAALPICLMGAVRPCPQYWLPIVTSASPMPMVSCWNKNCRELTAATPERAVSLYPPIIRLSAKLTLSTIAFCSTIIKNRRQKVR